MRDGIAQLERSVGVAGDPRWELVERIVASPCFVKSPRLCSFLTYICDLFLHGRAEEINETNIGEALFERPANYDASADGIVRSHASRLRQRLDQYFSEEGAHEPLRLLIPKGGYMPVFEPRTAGRPVTETLSFPVPAEPVAPPVQHEPLPTKHFGSLWILSVALALACVAIVYLLVHPRSSAASQGIAIRHPLWGTLFGPDRLTVIVASDTGLTSFQTLTGRKVSLAEYLNGGYRTHINAPSGTTADAVNALGSRRYTSIVDLDIVTKLFQVPGISPGRTQVRYARDLHLNDLKNGPVILLGAQEGTPWVELFERQMNFVLSHDRQRHSFVVTNRSPRGTELARYEADIADPQDKVYGLIALRPNLEGFGHILILEGTSMAGTESAADFVFDDTRLLPFLEQVKSRDGELPYFELLLQSNSMNGSASQSEVVAYRTSAH
jgi:hypothetical protein